MNTNSETANSPADHPSTRLAPLLGAAAAGIVGLGAAVPWTLGLAGATLVVVLSFLRNEAFLLALAFLLPLDYTLGEGAPVRDVAVAVRLLVAIGYFLGRLYHGRLDIRRLWRPAVTRVSCLFLACLVISIILGGSGEIHAQARGIFFLGTFMAFYLVMLDWLEVAERRRRIMFTMLCSTLIVAVFGVVQKFIGNYTALWHFLYGGQELSLAGAEEQGRVASFLGHPNHLATYLNLILPFAIATYLLTKKRLWKWLSAPTVVFGVAALALTESRGGYLALVAIIIYAVLHFAKTRWQMVLFLLAFGGLAVGAYGLLQEWHPGHFGDYASDTDVLGRLLLWSTAWNFFSSSPLHGVGIGAFPLLYDQYLANIPGMSFELGLQVHNIYLELLGETGILGLVSFFGVVVTVCLEARHQLSSPNWFQHAFAFGVAAGMIGALVGELFDHSIFWASQVGFLFWMGVAALVAGGLRGCNPGERTGRN